MVYRVIGLMSGSSLDGLDIAYVEFQEQGGKWTYRIEHSTCIPYDLEWKTKLADAMNLSAREFVKLDAAYGHYTGKLVNQFLQEHNLDFRVALIASHGHTVFHQPGLFSTQIGDGAAIAAETTLPVVSNLRSMDVALGGQGAPIVPMGEKLLFPNHSYFLNIGGIANISCHSAHSIDAFDVCPANRVLNLLANEEGLEYDDQGLLAKQGNVNEEVLAELNKLEYYSAPFPKSLANEMGTDILFPFLKLRCTRIADALATGVEHIAFQVAQAVGILQSKQTYLSEGQSMMVTGGGALNTYLCERIEFHLHAHGISLVIPDEQTVQYKEALTMAVLGVLRWREEENVAHSVTGAVRSSIGGALWLGNS